MNNNKVIAKMLNEAAYLLNEAAARDERKENIKNVKNIKNDNTVKMFLKGKLDPKEAKKVYEQTQKELKEIKKKISEIPDETAGEKVLGYFRANFTGTGYLVYFVTNMVTNVLGPIGRIAQIPALIAVYLGIISKTKDGEYNFNKAYAERKLNAFEKKLNAKYIKHYGGTITNLDEAIELLIETAYLIDDDFDYYE